MEDLENQPKVKRTISYDRPQSSTIFRICWYAIGRKPGVMLNEYSEGEGKMFKGKAMFMVPLDDTKTQVRLWVEEAQRSIELTAWGTDEEMLTDYLDDVVSRLETYIAKYLELSDEDRQKVRRALVAKTCWDRVIHQILNKAPLSSIYVQIAHGREMMIKATEGEEIRPLALTTSGWLTKIEDLPHDEVPPSDIAENIAKKSVEWKKETHEVIGHYL
ncbi:MAG: putative selenocysteine system protein [Promethearchaeia archaeon]